MKFKEEKEFDNFEKYAPECCQNEVVMYMGTTSEGIDMYKHYDTRRYMNIDDEGNFYLYNGEGYDKIDIATATEILLS